MFWMIEENVTPQGHYITHEGIFTTREACEHEILKRFGSALLGKMFRAVQYRRGNGSHGPERV